MIQNILIFKEYMMNQSGNMMAIYGLILLVALYFLLYCVSFFFKIPVIIMLIIIVYLYTQGNAIQLPSISFS